MDEHEKPMLSEVHRFVYDGSVRVWRYLFFVVGFGAVVAYMVVQSPKLDVIFIGISVGYVIVVLLGSEYVLSRMRRRAIEVDFDRGEVRLEYFVYPESFFDLKRKPIVIVPFDQVRAVQRYRRLKWYSEGSLWETVYVATETSRFVFSDYFRDYERLVGALEQIAETTAPCPPRTNPILPGLIAGVIAFGIVGFVGYLLGWI